MSSTGEIRVTSWAQPGYLRGRSPLRNAWRLCWQMFRPPSGHRTRPTRTGVILILLALAVGTAAFNTAQNILYLGLSLLLGSLLMSGVLSWLNFYGCRWRLEVDPHGRVGESLPVGLRLANGKRWLPTYGLASAIAMDGAGTPMDLFQEDRLGPGEEAVLTGLLLPERRGRRAVTIAEVASAYPFGFLNKSISGKVAAEVIVWAPRVDYSLDLRGLAHARRPGSYRAREGSGAELLNLREYRPGDPLRMIHWKATARTGHLQVRETVDESSAEFALVVETPRLQWNERSVDRLSAVASSLAEDLFMSHRLGAVIFNGGETAVVRRIGELHDVLGRLAELEPVDQAPRPAGLGRWVPLTFRARMEQIEILSGTEVVGVG